MEIYHYIFWIQNNLISAVNYNGGRMEILKIGGRASVQLTDDYRKIWSDYAGMCDGDKTDFCFIYDKKITPADDFPFLPCDDKDCIWSRTKIEKTAELLRITGPAEIRNENGTVLLRVGNFRKAKKEDIVTLTAVFRQSPESAGSESVSGSEETSSLMKYLRTEYKEYKKGYEK